MELTSAADARAVYPKERLLPASLTEAEQLALESEFVKRYLPDGLAERLFRARQSVK